MVRKWAITLASATATVCGGFASQVFLAPLAHGGPAYLQPCSDKDKLAVSPATGTGLVCTGKVWDQAPSVPAVYPFHRNAVSVRRVSSGRGARITATSIFCSSGSLDPLRE